MKLIKRLSPFLLMLLAVSSCQEQEQEAQETNIDPKVGKADDALCESAKTDDNGLLYRYGLVDSP